MLLSPNNSETTRFEIAPGFSLYFHFGRGGGDLDDGEPVYAAPPVTTTAGNCRATDVSDPCEVQRTDPSVGRRLREDLAAEFPSGCHCYNCVLGRQLQLA